MESFWNKDWKTGTENGRGWEIENGGDDCEEGGKISGLYL